MSNRSGKLIVIEGPDGSGKSSVAKELHYKIKETRGWKHQHSPWLTAQPSNGSIGKLIRQELKEKSFEFDAKTMALLFAADRADHINGEIKTFMDTGHVVICDRYILSSIAYQGILLGLGEEYIRTIHKDVLIDPDITIILDVSPEVAAKRNASKKELYDDLDKQKLVNEFYRNSHYPNTVHVDADRSIEVVCDEVYQIALKIINGESMESQFMEKLRKIFRGPPAL